MNIMTAKTAITFSFKAVSTRHAPVLLAMEKV